MLVIFAGTVAPPTDNAYTPVMPDSDSERAMAGRPKDSWSAQTPRRQLKRLTVTCAFIYAALLVTLMLCENLLIFPAPKYPHGDWQPDDLAYEDVYFRSADGVRLHGWYVAHPDPLAYVLFCHGNGEHVAYRANYLRDYNRHYRVAVFAFDYRGYGRSAGRPHEQGVLADAQAAQQWLAQRASIRLADIVLHGVSLGSGIAVHLAAENGARGLILESAFTSLPDVAAHLYWWAPVRLLMRSRLDSAAKIAAYNGPLLQAHGSADELIPLELGKRLYKAAPSQDKRFIEMIGNRHNSHYTSEYQQAIGTFLATLPTTSVTDALTVPESRR